MYFHIRMINDPAAAGRRAQSTQAHWDYLNAHASHMIARGPTVADDNEAETTGSVFFLEFPDWDGVRAFLANEPHSRNGIYQQIEVNRWRHPLGRTQEEFAGGLDAVHWYYRGYARPGASVRREALAEAHTRFFARYEQDRVIVRGGVVTDDGKEWIGSAGLIVAPTRQDMEALLAEEPLVKSGLYAKIIVQRHKFGGRPPRAA